MTTTTEHRQAIINGLRKLAQFLADHPEAPAYSARVTFNVRADNDQDGMAQVAQYANALGVEVTDICGAPLRPDTTHFHASLKFGPVEYDVVYIRRQEMSAYDAWSSYGDNFRAVERAA